MKPNIRNIIPRAGKRRGFSEFSCAMPPGCLKDFAVTNEMERDEKERIARCGHYTDSLGVEGRELEDQWESCIKAK